MINVNYNLKRHVELLMVYLVLGIMVLTKSVRFLSVNQYTGSRDYWIRAKVIFSGKMRLILMNLSKLKKLIGVF